MTLYLRYDDVVEITEETGLLSEDVVRRRGVGDPHGSGQGWMCTERQREIILSQESEERGGLTREELKSHRSTWRIRRKDIHTNLQNVVFVVAGGYDLNKSLII